MTADDKIYNVVTLKEHFDERMRSQDRAVQVAVAALEHRLEGMNEFRATVNEIANRSVTRQEFDLLRNKLSDQFAETKERTDSDIRSLRESRALLEGKASQSSVILAMILSISGLLLGVIGLLDKVIR